MGEEEKKAQTDNTKNVGNSKWVGVKKPGF